MTEKILTMDRPNPRQQEFLAVMGLADEFTAPMARFVTGDPDTDRLLTMLTEQNAFVTRLPDGVSYRFHHMMKVCAEQAFAALPEQTRRAYHGRYGAWYAAHGQYLHALAAYRKGEDYDSVGQRFESARAYHKKPCSFNGYRVFHLPQRCKKLGAI